MTDKIKIRVTIRECPGETKTFTLYRLPLAKVEQAVREACRKACPRCFEK